MVDLYHSNIDDEDVLNKYVGEIIADKFSAQSAILNIERERHAYIGSYDCEILTVHLANGKVIRLFLKDYRFSQRSKDNREQRRERELRIYRDLFQWTELGMPKYYGSIWDEPRDRFWLFLEFVDGIIIKDHNIEHGVIAAGWLGRMQGFFFQHPEYLSECDYLIRHDERYFQFKAELAIMNASSIAPSSATLLSNIVERYQSFVDIMVAQPFTLVHGAYIPWHILLDYSYEPVRVCPVDWELAALGSPFYDLAIFIDGVDPKTRDSILNAYRYAANQYNIKVPGRNQMQHIIDCFRLHRKFDWLSRGIEKGFSEKKVMRLVDQVEQLSTLILI